MLSKEYFRLTSSPTSSPPEDVTPTPLVGESSTEVDRLLDPSRRGLVEVVEAPEVSRDVMAASVVKLNIPQ